jgi:hypothetical protein
MWATAESEIIVTIAELRAEDTEAEIATAIGVSSSNFYGERELWRPRLGVESSTTGVRMCCPSERRSVSQLFKLSGLLLGPTTFIQAGAKAV